MNRFAMAILGQSLFMLCVAYGASDDHQDLIPPLPLEEVPFSGAFASQMVSAELPTLGSRLESLINKRTEFKASLFEEELKKGEDHLTEHEVKLLFEVATNRKNEAFPILLSNQAVWNKVLTLAQEGRGETVRVLFENIMYVPVSKTWDASENMTVSDPVLRIDQVLAMPGAEVLLSPRLISYFMNFGELVLSGPFRAEQVSTFNSFVRYATSNCSKNFIAAIKEKDALEGLFVLPPDVFQSTLSAIESLPEAKAYFIENAAELMMKFFNIFKYYSDDFTNYRSNLASCKDFITKKVAEDIIYLISDRSEHFLYNDSEGNPSLFSPLLDFIYTLYPERLSLSRHFCNGQKILSLIQVVVEAARSNSKILEDFVPTVASMRYFHSVPTTEGMSEQERVLLEKAKLYAEKDVVLLDSED